MRPERALVVEDVLVEALALEDVEVGQADGRGDRVAAEGVAVQEGVVALVERLGEAVGDDAGADRGVARGHALGAGDHVRDVAELVAGEHRAEAAEGADDLVGDEQHVVLVADLAHPLEVAGRRREAAAGVLHRLQEDRGDRLRALEEDLLLDLVGGPAAEGLRVVAVDRGAVDVGVRHLVRAGDQRLEGGLQGRAGR